MNLEEKTIEELIDIADHEYQFGRTIKNEPDKKYLACSYYSSLEDYEEELKYDHGAPVSEVETFYGPTLRSVCILAAEWTLNNTGS